MRLAATLIAFLLAGCVGSAAPEPTYTGRIDGAVVDNGLHPFGNLTVRLVGLGVDRTDTTSNLGGFTFRGLAPGFYTVSSSTPDARPDSRVVEVRDADTTRVILQLVKDKAPPPFVAVLKNRGHADLALPGGSCAGCSWSTPVKERPDQVVLRAVWESSALGPDQVRIALLDDAGQQLADVTGESPLELHLRGKQVPETDGFRVQVTFPDGFRPRPFDMESFLDLYYGLD